ncbi:hypothetical protein PIB30_059146 [Stylosanthes scabra]|uniref:Uncharacterized protein n=1 Tax=Stylosanthes scabra TaxID=79078 RepID=A0ABU6XI65_9FABA|nr:hypothetical protein [Stylosanthes scabra]
MKKGSLHLCVLQHDSTTPRHPLIKPRRGHQLCLSTHRHRSPCICVDHHSLAPEHAKSMPRRDPGSLGVALTLSTTWKQQRSAHKYPESTHRRGSPRLTKPSPTLSQVHA